MKLQSSEINPYKYSQLIFDKYVNIIKWDSAGLSRNGVKTTDYPYAKT
jgi:hypothetical protein